MDMEFFIGNLGTSTKGCIKMMSDMVWEIWFGVTEVNMKGNGSMGFSKEEENLHKRMGQ